MAVRLGALVLHLALGRALERAACPGEAVVEVLGWLECEAMLIGEADEPRTRGVGR
ncbi:MAG TPA: hypothetical protein VII16_08545 [Actinomycetes bacterium]